MKIWYSPYELRPLTVLNRFQKNKRRGFLIKIQTGSLEAGYADCHPLLEFGDDSVDVHIQKMRANRSTPLLDRAFQLAKIDGRAREDKRSLFSDTQVKSHYTCSDPEKLTRRNVEKWVEKGFSTIKVKIGAEPQSEAQKIKVILDQDVPIRWRFDANSGRGDDFLAAFESAAFKHVDFIEDPLPYNEKKWSALSHRFRVECAFDRPKGARTPTVFRGARVIKPARESIRVRKKDIITNSMDHPVGQSFAFLAAQRAVDKWGYQPRDYGLITAHLFRSDSFFKEISTASPFFKPSDGYGIGFNDLLVRQKWIPL